MKNKFIIIFMLFFFPVVTNAEVCGIWKAGTTVATDPLSASWSRFVFYNPNTTDTWVQGDPPNTITTSTIYTLDSLVYLNDISSDSDTYANVQINYTKRNVRTESEAPSNNFDTSTQFSVSYAWNRDCTCTTCTNVDGLGYEEETNECEGKEVEPPFAVSGLGSGFSCYQGCEVASSIQSMSINVHGRNSNAIGIASYTGVECTQDAPTVDDIPSDIGVTINNDNIEIDSPEVHATIPFAVATGGWEAYLKQLNPGLDFDVLSVPDGQGLPSDNIPSNPPLENQVADLSVNVVNSGTGQTEVVTMIIGNSSTAGSTTETSTTIDNGDGTTTTTTTGTINLRPITDAVTAGATQTANAINASTISITGAVGEVEEAVTTVNANLGNIEGELSEINDKLDTENLNFESDGEDTFSSVSTSFYVAVQDSPLLTSIGSVSFPSGGTCETLSIDVFGETLSTDIHCSTFDSIKGVLSLVMMFVWGFIAVRIVLSA
jgi:hypothetical protein